MLTEVVVRTRPEDTACDQVRVRLPQRPEGWTAEQASAYALERIQGGTVLVVR